MKFILLSVVCLLGAAVAKPALTKQKRDILPGDRRYGTDYHLNHHHAHEHHHELNEVDVARALGGYVGSYTVPDNTIYQNNINFQPLTTSYGPPHYTPGIPITTSQATGTVQKTVLPHVEVPAFSQQSTISNFKSADNVETISSGYRAPVQAAQPTPVPTYQPVVQLNANQIDAQYLPPVAQKTIQQTVVKMVQKPVDSYGIPIPESVYPTPATGSQQHQDVIETNSQDTSSSDVNTDAEETPAVTDHHETRTVQDTPVQHDVSAEADVKVDAQADAETDAQVDTAVKTEQPQVKFNQVNDAVQHPVTHQVQKTAKPTVQQQDVFQQSAQQFPEFYAGLSSGNFGGSFDGFRNFGSLDSGYQSYGLPSTGLSTASQAYESRFGNVGYGYPQNFNGNQYQGSYSTGPVQQDSTVPQFPQLSGSGFNQQFPQFQMFVQNPQFPQISGFDPNQQISQIPDFSQISQFPQVTGLGPNQEIPKIPFLGETQPFPQISSAGQSQLFPQPSGLGPITQVPQFPGFGQQGSNPFPTQIPNFVPTQFPLNQQGNNHAKLQPAGATVSAKSGFVNSQTVNDQQVQPADVQVNTHSNTNSFLKQSPASPSNSGYVY